MYSNENDIILKQKYVTQPYTYFKLGLFFLTDSEMFTQQLPHQHLVEPTVQLHGEERTNLSSMLLQLACHLAPRLP